MFSPPSSGVDRAPGPCCTAQRRVSSSRWRARREIAPLKLSSVGRGGCRLRLPLVRGSRIRAAFSWTSTTDAAKLSVWTALPTLPAGRKGGMMPRGAEPAQVGRRSGGGCALARTVRQEGTSSLRAH